MFRRRHPLFVALTLVIAAPLIWLACSDSGDTASDPKPPALPGYVRACGPIQPCGSAYECLGHICVPRGDGGASDGSAASGGKDVGGVASESGTVGPYQAQFVRWFEVPCKEPLGLASEGSMLWCGDNNSSTGHRFKRFTPGGQESAQCSFSSSLQVRDMTRDPSTGRVLALLSNYQIVHVQPGQAAQVLTQINGQFALASDSKSLLLLSGNSLTRYHPTAFSQMGNYQLDLSCNLATTLDTYLIRYCSGSGSGTKRVHTFSVHNLAKTSPTKAGTGQVTLDADYFAGITTMTGPDRLFVIAYGGDSHRMVGEFNLF